MIQFAAKSSFRKQEDLAKKTGGGPRMLDGRGFLILCIPNGIPFADILYQKSNLCPSKIPDRVCELFG